jgi:Capsule assembly protein Wzi
MTSIMRLPHVPTSRSIVFHALFALFVVFPEAGWAQRLEVGDVDESYLRILQISGLANLDTSFLIRPLALRSVVESVADTTEHPWKDRWTVSFRGVGTEDTPVFWHDPKSSFLVNSAFPIARNDGALTPGRGLTAALKLGATFRSGPLTVSIRPLLAFAQNSEFRLAPVEVSGQPEYAYPWRRIDLPQRFGPDSYWMLDPGQSEIRLDLAGVSTSVGTTNLWWGPGTRNAILMSNNAAGIPHFSVATKKPVGIGIGTVEAQWIFGRLQQSDWFDPAIEDPGRYVGGATVAFSPDFWGLQGLSVGVARVFYARVPEGGIPLGEFFLFFQTPFKPSLATPENPTGEDRRDQLFSLFARWVLPNSGFEVYGEWAQNDHNGSIRDYIAHLEHAQAYTLGLQKATSLAGGEILTFRGELTHLENNSDTGLRIGPTYYAHHLIARGYTQKGEVVGATVGPGGNSLFLGAEVHARWGRASTFVERSVRDKDRLLSKALANPDEFGFKNIDASVAAGGTLTLFRRNWEIEGGVSYTVNQNRYFVQKSDHSNWQVEASLRWRGGWSGSH